MSHTRRIVLVAAAFSALAGAGLALASPAGAAPAKDPPVIAWQSAVGSYGVPDNHAQRVLTLPAGKFLIVGQLPFSNASSTSIAGVTCELKESASGRTLFTSSNQSGAAGEFVAGFAQIPMTQAIELAAPADITVQCVQYWGTRELISVQAPSFSAIKLDAITYVN